MSIAKRETRRWRPRRQHAGIEYLLAVGVALISIVLRVD